MRPSVIYDVLDVLGEALRIYRAQPWARIYLIRKGAIRAVAEQGIKDFRFVDLRSAENTIQDACARRLNVKIAQFDGALEKWLHSEPGDLQSILLQSTRDPNEQKAIKSRLAEARMPAPPIISKVAFPEAHFADLLLKASDFKGGESDDHQKLKAFVARNPQVAQLPRDLSGSIEYALPSGDCVDVLFRDREE